MQSLTPHCSFLVMPTLIFRTGKCAMKSLARTNPPRKQRIMQAFLEHILSTIFWLCFVRTAGKARYTHTRQDCRMGPREVWTTLPSQVLGLLPPQSPWSWNIPTRTRLSMTTNQSRSKSKDQLCRKKSVSSKIPRLDQRWIANRDPKELQ